MFFVNWLDEAAEELNKILLLMLGCAVQVSRITAYPITMGVLTFYSKLVSCKPVDLSQYLLTCCSFSPVDWQHSLPAKS